MHELRNSPRGSSNAIVNRLVGIGRRSHGRDSVTDWTNEESDDALYADKRGFYKVEEWTKDELDIERMLWAGNSIDTDPNRRNGFWRATRICNVRRTLASTSEGTRAIKSESMIGIKVDQNQRV